MNDQDLIDGFTPVCKRQLASLSRTLGILTSSRTVTLEIRELTVMDVSGAVPESFRGPCVLSRGEVTLGYTESEPMMVFHLTDVLIIVGLMYMMEEAEILGKLETGYTEDDADAFGEAANQAYGGMAGVLADAFTGSGDVETRHLQTIEADFGINPKLIEELTSEPRLLRVEVDLQIEGYDPSEAVVYWPLSLVGQLVPQPGAAAAPAEAGHASSQDAQPTPRRLRKYDIDRVLRLKLPLLVLLASKQMTVSEIMALTIGSVIEFEKSSEEYLEFLIGSRTIATGEAGKIGEKFCLQIRRIGTPAETLKELL